MSLDDWIKFGIILIGVGFVTMFISQTVGMIFASIGCLTLFTIIFRVHVARSVFS